MTETEWLTCQDPHKMMWLLKNKVSARKLRLFSCACYRKTWDRLTDERFRQAVDLAERLADGRPTPRELVDAELALTYARQAVREPPQTTIRRLHSAILYVAENALRAVRWPATGSNGQPAGSFAAWYIAREAIWTVGDDFGDTAGETSGITEVSLLRDIFRYPDRPVQPPDPAILEWQGGLLARLAEPIYQERSLPKGLLDSERLAILADALVDAGYPDEELIQHCRRPGPHVRGCWAVDILLAKD